MKIAVMFYKGKGTILDKIIRWGTFSSYSHVEVVFFKGDINVGHGVYNIGRARRFGNSTKYPFRTRANRINTIDYHEWETLFLSDIVDDRAVNKAILQRIDRKYAWSAICYHAACFLGLGKVFKSLYLKTKKKEFDICITSVAGILEQLGVIEASKEEIMVMSFNRLYKILGGV